MDIEDTILARIKKTTNLLDRFMLGVKLDIDQMVGENKKVSPIQGRIVAFLYAKGGSFSQKGIEKHFDIRSSTSAILLRKMEKNGLVTREAPDPKVRRNMVSLTQQAHDFIPVVYGKIEKAERKVTSGIMKQELDVFVKVLDRICENISE